MSERERVNVFTCYVHHYYINIFLRVQLKF